MHLVVLTERDSRATVLQNLGDFRAALPLRTLMCPIKSHRSLVGRSRHHALLDARSAVFERPGNPDGTRFARDHLLGEINPYRLAARLFIDNGLLAGPVFRRRYLLAQKLVRRHRRDRHTDGRTDVRRPEHPLYFIIQILLGI